MPAVGMRRSTRVFGARVLRSGRRLWTAEQGETVKQQHHTRASAANVEGGLIEILGDSVDESKPCMENGRNDDALVLDQQPKEMDFDETTTGVDPVIKPNKRWGLVYRRKRKRLDKEVGVESLSSLDKRYGKQFSRKHGRGKHKESPTVGCLHAGCVLAAVVETSYGSSSLGVFSCLLNSILRYMKSDRLRLQHLSAFIFSEPIVHVYSSNGIHFIKDCTSTTTYGVCKMMDSQCFTPMFALDFTAVPFVFMYLHSSLLLRSAIVPYPAALYSKDMEVENVSMTIDMEGENMNNDEQLLSCITCEGDEMVSRTGLPGTSGSGKRKGVHRSAATPKPGAWTMQLRSSVSSRSIQKRRSSLRLRKGRKLSSFVVRKANGHLQNDLSSRHDGNPFSPVRSNHEDVSPFKENSMTKVKGLKSTLAGLTEDLDAKSCSANILVIESDKCYREEGATIMLESSSSNQWFIAVRKDIIRSYCLMAQKVMRPCSCNRVTHAIIWTSDDGWKLEFNHRRDWLIFKKLYKECFDLNVQSPMTSAIPVPRVLEVSGYGDGNNVSFRRPNSYITWKDDELTRALAKNTVIYDLDSDDEIWLNKFNTENFFENESDKHTSADAFELIINSFEKGFYCGQDDYSDVRVAVDLCISLERREVLEAVHSYWIKKRKQKRSSLIRVFQCYQPKRTQLLPKAIFRKKRSFKRQATKTGRGKPRTVLQEMAAERGAEDKQKFFVKVEEAKAAANRSEGVAVLKRKRAQLLMEIADSAIYKATIALQISEAIQLGESPEAILPFFLVD